MLLIAYILRKYRGGASDCVNSVTWYTWSGETIVLYVIDSIVSSKAAGPVGPRPVTSIHREPLQLGCIILDKYVSRTE